jgi:hypothetical protein
MEVGGVRRLVCHADCVAERDESGVEVQRLLDDLCIKLGFCLPPNEQHRLRVSPPPDADSFADTVFEAEGMDPRLYKQLRRQVRDTIDQHMRGWPSTSASSSPDQPGQSR